ncbi:MAG TPA: DUF5134 domain-containing protein [Actinocrinis sp.]
MNAPPWLPDILAVVMLAVAAFSLWRAAVARSWGRAGDYDADALHALIALALAGMLVRWLETLPRGVWTALFAAAALWFAGRLAWSVRRGLGRAQRGRYAAGAAAGAAMVYMLLAGVAPSTLDGSTAGQYTMAGMDGMVKDTTLDYPSLGLLLAAAMAVYAVAVLNRVGLAPAGDGAAAGGPGLPLLAPRAADCCRVVLAVTMAYAILTKIV